MNVYLKKLVYDVQMFCDKIMLLSSNKLIGQNTKKFQCLTLTNASF